MIYIGIDPGLDGAIAVIDAPGFVRIDDTPTVTVGTKREIDPAGVATLLRRQMLEGKCFAVIESVHSMPDQGVASSFSFGKGFGILIGACAAIGMPYELVTPQRWKKVVLDGMPKGKDAGRFRATALFPAVAGLLKRKCDDGRADALLMAEYGRRINAGQSSAA